MSEQFDFERYWLGKFSRCLDEVAGGTVREQVMEGSEALDAQSSREEVISWSRRAMERLEALVDEDKQRQVMTGCACQYPKSGLQDVRKAYEESGDIELAHRMLQERFESFLRDSLELSDVHFQKVVRRGWGLAGIIEGDTIFATKIPKSGYLVQYLEETDPERRRQIYCHCPRIRDVLESSETISATYCYCGAGYYRGIWEEILQQPVEVEVVESVLKGDEVCRIAIHLSVGR
jgi:predicted hydrocarbon binding protein